MAARANLITDVAGIRVGNADDPRLASGVTVALFDEPAVAAAFTPGGGPALRDTALLEPEMTVERVDAIVLSGGSAFGLDAASGVQAWLREQGRGLTVGPALVPIVPQAACFDLTNGGDKNWGRFPPYREMAHAACEAAGLVFALGTAGGGYGATTVDLKGGLGSTSAVTASGSTVGALVVVNALGSVVVGGGPHFWAGPWEVGDEFGGLGPKTSRAAGDLALRWKGAPARGTTIALVATDARLTVGQTKRLATMASAGMARALRLTFAPFDGDIVFGAATGRSVVEAEAGLTELGATAADCLSRAIARGIYAAEPLHAQPGHQSWRNLFGQTRG